MEDNKKGLKLTRKQVLITIIAWSIIGFLTYFDSSLSYRQYIFVVIIVFILWVFFGFTSIRFKK